MSIAAIREAPPPRSSRYRSLVGTLIILDGDDDDGNTIYDIGDGHDNDHWISK